MLQLQIFISTIADTKNMVILSLFVSLILFLKGRTKDFYITFFSTTYAMLITYSLKYAIAAPRPINMLVDQGGYRFPSGHATMAGVVCALIIYFAHSTYTKKNKRSKLIKYSLYAFALLWVTIVSYSRLYLGVHIPIDVIVGALIGISSTYIVLRIFHHLHYYK